MITNNKIPILLIEDNPADARMITMLLKESSVKHELFHTESFYEGVDIAKTQNIALVFLDLSLPDSNGFKTLSNFIEKIPNIPIIVLTGLNNEIVGNQAVKAGAQDFLVKGQFEGKLLGRAIRYAIQRFKTHLKLEETAKSLALSEKRYIEAQEMAQFGNWEMDIVSNSMKWTSEIYRIFGYQTNSLQPSLSDYLSYVHMEDKPRVEDFFEMAAKDGKLHKIEHRIVIEGRTIKHIALQAKVYYEETNDKIILVGAVQDVTERKLTEQLIIEKNLSQKASVFKQEALATMGFHVRTPLSSVINLTYLLENSNLSSQQKENLDDLKTSVEDLSIMVNNLLNFSLLLSENIKLEEEEFTTKDFVYSIEKVVKIKADNENIALTVEIDKNIPEKLIADHNKITQVLYNLINNAIKFTPEDGNILIKVFCRAINKEETQLCFSIKDSGMGMSGSKIKELLEAEKLLEIHSEHNDSKRPIGLAIVSKLIHIMNGELSIESKEQVGSTFEVSIPSQIPKQIQFLGSNKPEVALKILLVEDHFLNQIATKKILTTWSELVTVDIAENGLVGVDKFREHGYDLILMDIQMPVMNGIDASMKIRENSQVPIIALTANSSKQEADRCLAIGINDYISKPFKPTDLYAKIMSLLVSVSQS